MSVKTTKFQVRPLRGMDQRWHASPNNASLIQNMTWSDQDSWRTAVGYKRINVERERQVEGGGVALQNPFDTSEQPLSSLFWFSQRGNALQWLIFENSFGELRYVDGSLMQTLQTGIGVSRKILDVDGNAVTRNTSLTFSDMKNRISHSDFETFGTNLYIVNGVDAPIVYDGRKVTRAGFTSRPDQPKCIVADKNTIHDLYERGVGNHNANNRYRYKVTFVNERGQESRMSEPSSTITFDTTDSFTTKESSGTVDHVVAEGTYRNYVHLNLPIGPQGTVARRIYRTQNMVDFFEELDAGSSGTESGRTEKLRDAQFGREFFFLAEVQDNISTIFSDHCSDAELASLMEETDLGNFPTNSTMLAVFKNTLFVASNQNEEVRYSRPSNPEVFPPDNVFNLSDNQTSLITGMYSTGDSLIVFKHRSTYVISGNPLTGFFASTLTNDLGCIAHNSIREVPGLGLVFLSQDGIYVLQGIGIGDKNASFFKLSQSLNDVFFRINTQYAEKFRSLIYHKDREYWLSVCIDEKSEPDTILKFSYEIGAWSIYTDIPNVGFVEVQDTNSNVYFAGGNDTEIQISQSYSINPGNRGIYVYGGSNTSRRLSKDTTFSEAEKDSIINFRESIYETTELNFNGIYENFSLARVQARLVGYGTPLELEIFTNRKLEKSSPISGSSSGNQPISLVVPDSEQQKIQLRPLEDLNIPTYSTPTSNMIEADSFQDLTTQVFLQSQINYYPEVVPINLRYDFSTLHKGPVNEIKLKFSSKVYFEILGYSLEARLGRTRDIINLTSDFGGEVTR